MNDSRYGHPGPHRWPEAGDIAHAGLVSEHGGSPRAIEANISVSRVYAATEPGGVAPRSSESKAARKPCSNCLAA